MKKLFILILCCLSIVLFANGLNYETSVNQEKIFGSWSSKDVVADILGDEDSPIEQNAKASEIVFFNPGSFHPVALLEAGIYFLAQKDLEKGALLSVAAILRAELDVRLSRDITLEGVASIINLTVENAVSEFNWSDADLEAWRAAKLNAFDNFEAWDKNILYDYDRTWLFSHSLGGDAFETNLNEEDKKRIIDSFYLELKGGISEKDDYFASREDEFYFDLSNRIFYHDESKLKIYLDNDIQPQLDRFGKYICEFKLPNDEYIKTDYGWSSIEKSFANDYEKACLNSKGYKSEDYEESDHSIELYIIANEMLAYKKRYTYSSDREPYQKIVNVFHIVKDHNDYDFEISTTIEKEKESLQYLEKFIDNIEFLN